MANLCNYEGCNSPRAMPAAFCEKHLHEWKWEKSDREQQISEIEKSTGDCAHNYEIIDVIFVFEMAPAGWFTGPDASNAFDSVKRKLAIQAIEMGGDLVLFCKFDYRNVSMPTTGVEILAYGTVAKISDD